jgi:hypothetical protein
MDFMGMIDRPVIIGGAQAMRPYAIDLSGSMISH